MHIPIYLRALNRLHPTLVWQQLAKKNSQVLSSSKLILSFDCDTEDDINVGLDVHKKLQDMGIAPVYAVPGELLKKGEKVYQKIRQTGAEFINHGGREHTYFDAKHNRHASCFFYDQQAYDVLKEDILLGHKTLNDVLGVTPIGWRTPHFGTFQQPEHLNFLYLTLKELDYKFSTSTSPVKGYQYGSLYKQNEMIEIPVTGVASTPFDIMDTWAFFAAPDRHRTPLDYIKSAQKLVELAIKKPILINMYGDPSHIYDKPEFFQAMKILSERIENINYTQLIEIIDENVRHI